MGVLLVCDAPGCFQTTQGIVQQNRAAAPEHWWMQPAQGNELLVACCDEHLTLAMKSRSHK